MSVAVNGAAVGVLNPIERGGYVLRLNELNRDRNEYTAVFV